MKKARLKNKHKFKARAKVTTALANGSLIRSDVCTLCGADRKIEAHHWSYDQNNWLDIVWLCRECHLQIHRELKEDECPN